jgi:hypothetical protein
MKDELRSMDESNFTELRRPRSAVAVSSPAVLTKVEAAAAKRGKPGKDRLPDLGRWSNQAKVNLRNRASQPARYSRCGKGGSSPVKPGQTDSLSQAAGQNPCKGLKLNNLKNKQLHSSRTMFNLVKHGQNQPFGFGFGGGSAPP